VAAISRIKHVHRQESHAWRILLRGELCQTCAIEMPPISGDVAGSGRSNTYDMSMIDCAQLEYRGNGHREDSFALALAAAARLLGQTANYETISCLAGNAFSLFRNLAEDCTSHCQLEARHGDRAMMGVAPCIGLSARKLALPTAHGAVTDEAPKEYLQAVAKVVEAAMAQREVVIVLTGWKVADGLSFNHWGYAGLVTMSNSAAGVIRGAHLNGRKDVEIVHPPELWAVSVGDAIPTTAHISRIMIRHAVDAIRGLGAFRAAGRAVYGIRAMDAWIQHMRTVEGYCAPCYARSENSWHDAEENGQRLVAGARVAARQLRALGPVFEGAARHYDEIDRLFGPSLDESSPDGYQRIIGDLAKQRAHAESVLVPVRAELVAAADEMEAALLTLEYTS